MSAHIVQTNRVLMPYSGCPISRSSLGSEWSYFIKESTLYKNRFSVYHESFVCVKGSYRLLVFLSVSGVEFLMYIIHHSGRIDKCWVKQEPSVGTVPIGALFKLLNHSGKTHHPERFRGKMDFAIFWCHTLPFLSHVALTFVEMNYRRWLQQLIKSVSEVDIHALDRVMLINHVT